MTLSSFEAELYRSASLSKVISWDTLYLVFKDRFLLQPKPDLDAQDSFRLPSADVLSSQGNGDFTVSHEPCQASLATFSIALQLRLRRGLFRPAAASHASSILKGEGVRCVSHDAVAYAFKVMSRSAGLFQPMKQPLSFDSPEREAARQTRSL
jgi:hypothetical protein